MLISFTVMALKALQVRRVESGNKAFLALFHSKSGDFGALHRVMTGAEAAGDVEWIDDAPLSRLFMAGAEELHQRLEGERNRRGPALSSQSIEAIRAAIDATLVEESQALSRSMVLLTIAISGGPFIGLLGTVVGVMITFAAVAAAGDVNVNAIAPGIAAALAATVAGLMVAIPALFGYNYLITRIKEIGAQMHVFVDRLITRMAENYNQPAALHEMAD
ncbi:MAG TPA: MotA/TolQ/ExbB proton channel family protein, partial [Nevskiaceae bacterium]|nr:MotA/TolQ/ExbB proton channel family protein [Nevskiaceae bacterium]